jgi:hypothetical protein
MSSQPSRFGWAQGARIRILALLLVGALLLCHGVFGALHLCSVPPAGAAAHHAGHQHAPSGAGTSSHEHHTCHLMHAATYYAVLLTALLGLALGFLLITGLRLWRGITVPTSAVFRRCRLAVLYPPRGPTASPIRLQVLRL